MPWLPVSCNIGVLVIELLVEIECRWCCSLFHICRRCFRNQAYCCDMCRNNGRLRNRREAQQRYSKSDHGLEARNLYKHSQPLTSKKTYLKKSIILGADTSSTPLPASDTVLPEQRTSHPCCHKCGRIGRVVDEFPRRLYGDDRSQPFYVP